MKVSGQNLMMISRTFTITMVRHGETMSNRDRIMQGQLDTELSDLGHEQARLVGLKLRDVAFTHMYTSDLRRAADTARAITAANTVSPGQLIMDKLLRERAFGCMEGRPLNEFFETVKQTGIPAAVYTPDGGETVPQVGERAVKFLNNLCQELLQSEKTPATPDVQLPDITTSSEEQELPHAHVLVVSHGLMLRELRLAVMRYYLDDLDPVKEEELKKISPNTGRSQFEVRACRKGKSLVIKVVSVDLLNDNSHLTEGGNNLTTQFKGAL